MPKDRPISIHSKELLELSRQKYLNKKNHSSEVKLLKRKLDYKHMSPERKKTLIKINNEQKIKRKENETEQQRAARLQKDRQFQSLHRNNELTAGQLRLRLQIDDLERLILRGFHSMEIESECLNDEEEIELQEVFNYFKNVMSNVNNNEKGRAVRIARLQSDREAHLQARALQSEEQQLLELEKNRLAHSKFRHAESEQQRLDRLSQLQVQREKRASYLDSISEHVTRFENSINIFADSNCDICTKRCFSKQVASYNISNTSPLYLAEEFKQKKKLTLCHRCKSHVNNKNKITYPSKAYWNNLNPGKIPSKLEILSQAEQRLISRINPFIKIIKISGQFGQYSFKGQAILFAQDVFEVVDQLPRMLPRSTQDAGMILVTETLENLNVVRELRISRENVFAALQWLRENNPLYSDVEVNENVHIDERDLIRVQDNIENEEFEIEGNNILDMQLYKPINDAAGILRASWHQGDTGIFTSPHAGVQCCAMALAAIIRSSIFPPNEWNTNTLNENLIQGDSCYTLVRDISTNVDNEYNIPTSGYLLVRNFDCIKDEIEMYNSKFSISYGDEPSIYGGVMAKSNTTDSMGRLIYQTLLSGLNSLFESHEYGIIISNHKSFAIMKKNEYFYFADSHSCGLKGAKAGNGKACIIQCTTIQELERICKRNVKCKSNNSKDQSEMEILQQHSYTIDYIDVNIICQDQSLNHNYLSEEYDNNQAEYVPPIAELNLDSNYNDKPEDLIEACHNETSSQCDIPIRTSIMLPIDSVQPDVSDELQISENLNKITRKTKDNIVNVAHEQRAEEYAWYHLFPYGVNGFQTPRPVTITPLDYYQYRILGSDDRFRRNDYLFYALSMFEYYRIKSTIAACGKKIQGQDGMIDDVHLYMRNLRGTGAFWNTILYELLAQIRCLGPPQYFVTLSCNDLNWLDMRKALLIADKRSDVNPKSLSTREVQLLIENHPEVIARHFMIRVNALMVFMKNCNEVFGGKVIDYWWRIEFQNRGSPHLHMVVWLENYPQFDTQEGLQLLNNVCSCEMPEEESEIYELVKKCQKHHHTPTCFKNGSATCRFSFPRQECEETKIVAHSSDDFIRSGGRICLLKRRKEDIWINNYNPILLKLWQGNMDIQPCGSNESIAFYIAKYVSKSEPVEMDYTVAQAIRQIRREETDISRKLFKVCMRILKERQVSACECIFRLCHLNLKQSSRNCIFLNTRKPEQRYKVIKFDGGGRATGFCQNIFERYENRPLQHARYDFQNMSLTEFAMMFEPYYPKSQEEEELNVDDDMGEVSEVNTSTHIITLINKSKIKTRSKPAVVRVPYFKASTDQEYFYYSLLLQYMPYRQEAELLDGFNSAKDSFLDKEDQLKQISSNMELYRTRDRQLENAFIQVHAFELIDNYEPSEDQIYDEIEIADDRQMSNEEFSRAFQAMNIEQKDLISIITASIQAQLQGSTDRTRIFVTGGAGTGKSFTLKIAKNQINRCYGHICVKISALTGVAARIVTGSTLHSTFKLPVQKDGKITEMHQLTGNYLRIMRQEWKNTEWLFIDEISMVPYEMLCMIESRLRQLKNKEDELFGGMNIIVFGDLFQLPPVRGNQVFIQPRYMEPAINLWRVFSLCELQQNMRQQGDDTFINILNALRVGELNSHHINILMQKVSKENDGEFSIERALRIYPTNKQVDDHNNTVLKHFEKKGVNMWTIKAQDQIIDTTKKIDNVDLDKIISKDIAKTAGLPTTLTIFVGAKVMLRTNVDVSKGLVNGAIGHVTDVIWPNFRRGQAYETDIPSVKIDFGRDGSHVIKPVSLQFPAMRSYGTAERRMLPIVLSWASTVHKMQGSTVDHAVIYLGRKLFAEGQAYVALSRVRSLDGLRIQELSCEKISGKRPCNQKALEEMERLHNMH